MLERTNLITKAANVDPSVIVGSTRCVNLSNKKLLSPNIIDSIPDTGNKPQLTEKTIISICPNQKLGKEYKVCFFDEDA